VNLKYVDVERDLITVGMTTATVQCDYQYIATLKKAYFYYGEGEDEVDMNAAEMRVLQNTLYVDLAGLHENTTYSYYYEFHNGFNSMRSAVKTFKTEGSGITITLPTVVTAEVTEITTNSAKCGGEVTNNGGAEVTERGICWGTNANPTLNDSHIASGSGTGAFTAMMNSLEANTTYHVRAYATNEKGTAYGLDREFVTDNGGGGCDCGYVDLGLPSGTLWATCNVGASSPEEYGNYFAWGEIEQKSIYNWGTYRYCNGDEFSMTKYCNDSDYGFNGFTDNLMFLEADDDAATTSWGGEWCTPTKEQWMELLYGEAGSWMWTSQDGVNGLLFTANNGNSIFFPASGKYDSEAGFVNGDNAGHYWSNSLFDDNLPKSAWRFFFTNGHQHVGNEERSQGLSVRPVRKTNTPTPPGGAPEGAINGLFTINENGDQVYFSQGNLQYQASTNSWKFAENQWDYVGTQTPDWSSGMMGGNVEGSDNNGISASYDGWIDLFGWGTSGYNHGAVCFQPWSISNRSGDYCPYGSNIANLFDGSGQADWGYNSILNGGNRENLWRTLKVQEWDYVINHRITESGIRYVKAEVNDVKGLLLLPDSWNVSVYDFNCENQSDATFTSNVISENVWKYSLQLNGVVFLPMAGDRILNIEGNGECNVTAYVGQYGLYWSSSLSIAGSYRAFQFLFSEDYVNTYFDNRPPEVYFGLSVRLVQDAN
jgi:hypothetical protein